MIKKVILGVLAIALIAGAAPVSAQTNAELTAQVNLLLAQVAALTAQLNAGASASVTLTRNLTLGSTGPDVMWLQKFLNSHGCPVALSGVGSVGMETSYFGAKTKAAVACWQAAHNITPAVGYVGPITRGAINAAVVVVTPPGTTPPGTTPPVVNPPAVVLHGGAGSINDADFVGSLNNEEVGEDATDQKVAGLEIEADEGSDIELQAVRLVFTWVDNLNPDGSDDFEDYADEVSLWFEGKEVARLDGDEFNDDNDFSRTVSLDSGAVIRADEVGELVVAISGVGNIDSADIGQEWTVEFDTVRFRDAQNAIISETSVGDIGSQTRSFTFESFASATDVELEVVESNDNPDSQIVEADDSDDTTNVLLLAGELKNNGDSDVEVQELTITVTSAGTASTTEIASSFTLVVDGDDVQTVNSSECDDGTCTSASEEYTFDDVDTTLGGGDSADFEIRADINEVDGTIVAEGDSLTVDVDAEDIVAEDESGEDLGNAELEGTISGNEQVFYTVFPEITVVGTPSISYVGDDTANATVSFVVDVQAVGGTIYLNGDDEATAAKEAFQASVLGGNSSTTLSDLVYTVSGDFDVTNNGADNEFYTITSGNTMRFTLTGTLTQGAGPSTPAGAEIDEIQFGTDATSDTTRSAGSVDFDDLMDQLETPLKTLIG